MVKVISGLSSIEREQVDKLNELNVADEFWNSLSITAILAHLIECSDKDEVEMALANLTTD